MPPFAACSAAPSPPGRSSLNAGRRGQRTDSPHCYRSHHRQPQSWREHHITCQPPARLLSVAREPRFCATCCSGARSGFERGSVRQEHAGAWLRNMGAAWHTDMVTLPPEHRRPMLFTKRTFVYRQQAATWPGGATTAGDLTAIISRRTTYCSSLPR